MARRGRKRKSLALREPNGQIRRARARARRRDRGTAESQAKRIMAVGGAPFTELKPSGDGVIAGRILHYGPADPAYASSSLGILFARGALSDDQFRAGHQYAALRAPIGFRSPHTKSPALGSLLRNDGSGEGPAPEWDAEEDEENMRRYRAASDGLKAAGRAVLTETVNLCIYDRMPGWFAREVPRPSDTARRVALMEGLDWLIRFFDAEVQQRRAAAE